MLIQWTRVTWPGSFDPAGCHLLHMTLPLTHMTLLLFLHFSWTKSQLIFKVQVNLFSFAQSSLLFMPSPVGNHFSSSVAIVFMLPLKHLPYIVCYTSLIRNMSRKKEKTKNEKMNNWNDSKRMYVWQFCSFVKILI